MEPLDYYTVRTLYYYQEAHTFQHLCTDTNKFHWQTLLVYQKLHSDTCTRLESFQTVLEPIFQYNCNSTECSQETLQKYYFRQCNWLYCKLWLWWVVYNDEAENCKYYFHHNCIEWGYNGRYFQIGHKCSSWYNRSGLGNIRHRCIGKGMKVVDHVNRERSLATEQ